MQERDLLLCTVERISPTVVFVRLPDGNEGTIISSEIAPGRIKNMRAHVVPKKKVVCKILKISGDHVQLSLRRVTARERKEVMQEFKQEQAIKTSFKQILKEEAENVERKINEDFKSLKEFCDIAREDKQLIEKYIPKEKQEQIEKILNKKKKSVELNQIVKLKCIEDDGINKIRNTLDLKGKEISITYISAGKFKLKLIAENFKQGKKELQAITEQLEENAKKNSCEIHISEDKK
jgi:translation initiation factor 2 alpha subunit (eIF-2alpha)